MGLARGRSGKGGGGGIAVERVPVFTNVGPPPGSIAETYDWLRAAIGARSHAVLDDGASGKPEGVVVRDGRRAIAKIRFEDYERTLGTRR